MNTCATCRFWRAPRPRQPGESVYADTGPQCLNDTLDSYLDGAAAFAPPPEFGCVLHEPKEAE